MPASRRYFVVGVAAYALELFDEWGNLDTLCVPIDQGSEICGFIAARDALGLKTVIVGVKSTGAPS